MSATSTKKWTKGLPAGSEGKKWTKDQRQFTKEITQMINDLMKRYFTFLAIRKAKIKLAF